jgi:hypothetical protein
MALFDPVLMRNGDDLIRAADADLYDRKSRRDAPVGGSA